MPGSAFLSVKIPATVTVPVALRERDLRACRRSCSRLPADLGVLVDDDAAVGVRLPVAAGSQLEVGHPPEVRGSRRSRPRRRRRPRTCRRGTARRCEPGSCLRTGGRRLGREAAGSSSATARSRPWSGPRSAAENVSLNDAPMIDDEAHQREPDHERGGRGRRAPRVAHRVLAGEQPGDAAWSAPPATVSSRAAGRGDQRAQHRDPDEHQQRGDPDQQRAVAAARVAEQARRTARPCRDARGRRRPRRSAAGPRRTDERLVAQRRDRRDPSRPARRREGRHERDAGADEERHDDRARLDLQRAARQVDPERARTTPRAASRSRCRARARATDEKTPTTSASSATEPTTWRPRRTERAQQPELPDPLRDGDRERVVDDERADEQRDQREDQQERVEERQVVLDRVGLLLGVARRR